MITQENKNDFYELHKKLADEQGRRPAWLAKQLDCSYALIYGYFTGGKYMSLEKVQKIHKILVG